MKTFPPWYKLLPRRLTWEREVLHGLQFFKHEADSFDEDANFTATGTLFYRGERSGKPESFRLEVVYPRRFPGIAQMVYDKEKRFALFLLWIIDLSAQPTIVAAEPSSPCQNLLLYFD